MKSSEYWKKREADALKSYQKDEEAYYEEIQEIYADMMERIQKEIDSFISNMQSKKISAWPKQKESFTVGYQSLCQKGKEICQKP